MLRRQSRFALFVSFLLVSFLSIVGCNRLTVSAPTVSSPAVPPAAATTLTISAATSLKDSLTEIKQVYTSAHPEVTLRYNFGASGALQQQIEQGAPADIFISAATKQMNALQDKGLLLTETRQNLLSNQMVLVTPANGVPIKDFADLANDRVQKIAIGQPDSVPAGKYAQEVLTSQGVFDRVQSKLVFAKDVRQVLSYVETGNVDAGMVYVTDVKVSNKINIALTASPQSHTPIVYPIAVLKDSKNAIAAQAFVQFLAAPPAQRIFAQYGFTPKGKVGG